jgi:hypothetical protein
MGFGGGIFNKNGGSITLNDDAIASGNYLRYCDQSKCDDDGFCPTGMGGGISSIGGTVTLNGSAQVSGNWAGSGGGIDLESGASLTLNDNAMVTGNEAGGGGGGVRVYYGTQLTLNGAATISGNTAGSNGGGVANASVTPERIASITGNTVGITAAVPTTPRSVERHPVSGTICQLLGNTPNDVTQNERRWARIAALRLKDESSSINEQTHMKLTLIIMNRRKHEKVFNMPNEYLSKIRLNTKRLSSLV